MLSAGIHAMVIQAHIEDLTRRTRKSNAQRTLSEAGVVTTPGQSSLLDRARKRWQRRSPRAQSFGITGEPEWHAEAKHDQSRATA